MLITCLNVYICNNMLLTRPPGEENYPRLTRASARVLAEMIVLNSQTAVQYSPTGAATWMQGAPQRIAGYPASWMAEHGKTATRA